MLYILKYFKYDWNKILKINNKIQICTHLTHAQNDLNSTVTPLTRQSMQHTAMPTLKESPWQQD